ncbi:MAG: hypothetical protein PUG56_01920 [Ruminococcus sp.]|nr:hypothetical protein [Ruminococcus sp.]MDY5895230.1 hypothetical protein [Oscillospiraceae bacterium]
MNLTKYIEEEIEKSKLSRELVTEMRKFSEDKHFIAGVLVEVENDDDKKALLEYIMKGQDVNYEQIILNALWLSQQRDLADQVS